MLTRALVALALLAVAAPAQARHPLALQAEEALFGALVHDPSREADAGRLLDAAALTDPGDARTQLLLGLYHLWRAEEGDMKDPRTVEQTILAAHHLRRSSELDPSDTRIPSWLVPAELAIAGAERTPADAAMRTLLDAYQKDPWFHAAGLAFVAVRGDPRSPEFASGLAALDRMEAICRAHPPRPCTNGPRWPHRVEGLLLFRADYELAAGHTADAERHLRAALATPDAARWPYRDEAKSRLTHIKELSARFRDGDRSNDPVNVLSEKSRIGCRVCHAQ